MSSPLSSTAHHDMNDAISSEYWSQDRFADWWADGSWNPAEESPTGEVPVETAEWTEYLELVESLDYAGMLESMDWLHPEATDQHHRVA